MLDLLDKVTSFIAAIAGPIIPVITLLIGWRLSKRDEGHREERQRARDREQRRREAQRNTLTELQLALAESAHGAETAANMSVNPAGLGMTAAMKLHSMVEPQWYQDWLAASRKVEILETRISHVELRRLVRAFAAVASQMRSEMGHADALRASRQRLHSAYKEANDLAGKLYQDLDADPPAPARLHSKGLRKRLRIGAKAEIIEASGEPPGSGEQS